MEVNVWQVLVLLVFILTANSIRDAMTLNFADLNAGARVRPVVGVSAKAIVWVAVEKQSGTVRRLPMRITFG